MPFEWNMRMARPTILFMVIAVLILLSLTSGVWASPGQSGLRQTVPTRTPTKMPTPTSLPPTEEPTPVPPTPTSVPPTLEPTQPISGSTQGPATPVLTPGEPPQPTIAVVTEFPKAGADFTPWIGAGVALLVIVLVTLGFLRLRRTSSGR